MQGIQQSNIQQQVRSQGPHGRRSCNSSCRPTVNAAREGSSPSSLVLCVFRSHELQRLDLGPQNLVLRLRVVELPCCLC